MTITMAKSSRLVLLPLAAGLCAAFPAHAAWDFSPIANARATYSDNITLQADENAHSGFVGQLSPGFELTNRSQRFDFKLDYMFNLYEYSGKRQNGAQRHSQDQDEESKQHAAHRRKMQGKGRTSNIQ